MKQLLDRLTNSFTMYRLTIYSLGALATIAIVFSALNILDYDPIYMTLGLGVLLGSSIVVNYLIAYVFSIRVNIESSSISALILFFIFAPASSLNSLITLAIIAAIAMASKYIIAWRGRHIFNPAATGAVISGVAGLGYAGWWVATGSLVIPTAILAILVLYKTRRLKMGLLYIAVSAGAIIIIKLFGRGVDLPFLQSILASWPLIFFAGFMLSEPLTQPPRRYQRYIYAVATALITYTGFHIAPEIALLIGNAFAFVCGQRGGIRLKFVGKKELGNNQVEYSFLPSRRLHYQAGQYIELQLPHRRADARGTRRMFTITSSPHENELKIAVRHYDPSSTFKKTLAGLKKDQKIKATGIYGDFLLPSNEKNKLLLIAGGIGITPFHSQLEWLRSVGKKRDGILLYSVRDQKDAVYLDVLQDSTHGIKTIIATKPIDTELLRKIPDLRQRTVYISGPPGMVLAMEKLAKQLGVKKVVTDFFSGY